MLNIFSQNQLKYIFPFHILVNNNLKILEIGDLISKLMPYPLVNETFYDYFKLTNTRKQQSFDQLLKAQNKLFFLNSLDSTITLKGAFYKTAEPNILIYIGNILPHQISPFIETKISVQDFPTYDSFPDFLFIQRANEKAIEELKLSYKKIKSTKTFSEKVISSMIDIVIVIDNKGNIVKLNDSFYLKLKYSKTELIGKSIATIIDKDSSFSLPSFLGSVYNESFVNLELNIIAKDKSLIPFSFSFSKIVNDEGSSEALVCIAQDITLRNRIELEKTKSLKAEIEAKNAKKQSTELKKLNDNLIKSEAKIQKSLDEKDILLREIHHRVKNNLQVITSLLSLQSSFTKDNEILEMFEISQQRINSMALIHEMHYKTEDFTKINYKNYLRELYNSNIASFFTKSHKAKLELDVSHLFLNLDTAIPLGLLINEILTNSFKYGLNKETGGVVYIKIMALEYPNFILYIGDDGVGMPIDFNYQTSNSLGVKLVYKLASQLQGKVEMDSSKKGTHYIIHFQEISTVF